MSFLQPWLLAALPLVALPVIIHLINQRRFQTIRWAAMMFLLAANRMSRGYAKIRQWLILALRVAAIGALVFTVSRPLAGGWLGLAGGGRADTTIILLDRSPSMEQGGTGGISKRQRALRQLVPALETLGSSRWVLIESGSNQPRELETVEALLNAPEAGPSSASADLPAMLQAAHDYIRTSKAGRTEIWICSDIRRNDWHAESGRWRALRDGFLEFPQGVRFHLLAYPETASENLAVRVTEVRHRKAADGGELLVSLQIDREGEIGSEGRRSVPLRFEIDGSRSEAPIELTGSRTTIEDHRIPLAAGQVRGWGRVSIPADVNPADNQSWFVFDQPAPRSAVVVSEEPLTARPLRLAASIPPTPGLICSAETVSADRLAMIDWENLSLLLWQAPLPENEAAKQVRSFLDRGGFVIFFPPREPGDATFAGVAWTAWNEKQPETSIETWRGDEGLLAHGRSGVPLPLGELKVRKSCGLSGTFTPLATLRDGAPLLARVAMDRGGLFFCATTPTPGDSSLATDGVAFYVLVQRALAGGSEALENTGQLIAGPVANRESTSWKPLAGAEGAISTDYPGHGGIYEAGPRLLAVNRDPAESPSPTLTGEQVAALFQGLDFSRVDDRTGGASSLIQEIWRLFLVALMVAMVAEAVLCLPKRGRNPSASGAFS